MMAILLEQQELGFVEKTMAMCKYKILKCYEVGGPMHGNIADEGRENNAEMADSMGCVCEQRILRAHKDALDAGHSVLLEKEVLMGEEVEQLIIDHPPTELPTCTDGAASSNGQGGAPARELSVGATA